MALSGFTEFLIIFVGALLIATGALGVNLHNRCGSTGGDQASKGEQIYFILMLVIGILVFLFVPLSLFYCHHHSESKIC